jgi:ribosome-associated protein
VKRQATAKSPKTARAKPKRPAAVTKLLKLVQTSLDDDKAEDIVAIDLEGKASFADFMVVATGRSQRHVGAIAEHLVENLSKAGHATPRIAGQKTGDWVLVDAGDVVVHLFRPEVRKHYNLEKMWSVVMPPADDE